MIAFLLIKHNQTSFAINFPISARGDLNGNPRTDGLRYSAQKIPKSIYVYHKHPGAYLQRAYLGREKLSWLSTDWVLSQFSKRKSIAHKKFRDFIYEGIGEGRREEFYKGTKEGRILGDDRFVDEVLRLREERVGPRLTLEQILQRVCDRYGIELESITASGKQRGPSEVRGMISWIVREAGHLSLTELSKRINRDISSLSVAARRLVEKSKIDTRLAKKMAQLKLDLL